MKNRERENATLSFKKPEDRGAVLETFFPWNLTVQRWQEEGLTDEYSDVYDTVNVAGSNTSDEVSKYLDCRMTDGVAQYENYFGFDGLRRVFFNFPFLGFEEEILEETDKYTVKKGQDGWVRKYYHEENLVEDIEPVVADINDWQQLKDMAEAELEKYYSVENMEKVYGPYRQGHKQGEYSVRMAIEGFFWTPRELLGIEKHMLAFYDQPDLIHDINNYLLSVYKEKLTQVLDILPADVVYIMEDLSGGNGPMLAENTFKEFVGSYYCQLVPVLKEHGVRHVFVDTDGDFNILIPQFMDAGIEGFLPMDVNAGMDIVKVREKYPDLKLIGAFNKLKIAEGKEAIDKEFARLLPVIRQGGYIPGCDHQVAPSTALADYKYYVKKLKEVMKEAGSDIK